MAKIRAGIPTAVLRFVARETPGIAVQRGDGSDGFGAPRRLYTGKKRPAPIFRPFQTFVPRMWRM